MLRPPLRGTDYDGGFGTLYTAVYRPAHRMTLEAGAQLLDAD
jgi:hypothetical protein